MTVNRSGMNILIELTSRLFNGLISSVATAQLPLLRPAGYTRFDLVCGYGSYAYWSERPRLGEAVPDFMVRHRVRLESEMTDGTIFRYGRDEGEELYLFFQAIPEVCDDGVCVKLTYRGTGQWESESMVVEDLGPEIDLLRDELCRSPIRLSFEIPFWGRPEPFHTPRLLGAYITRPAGGALTIGIEVEGGSETLPYTFMGHDEFSGSSLTRTLFSEDVFEDLIELESRMVIAVEGELMDALAETIFEEEVLAHQASADVFHGSVEYIDLQSCQEFNPEHPANCPRYYQVDCGGELHAEVGRWSAVWDDATASYSLTFNGFRWYAFCEDLVVEDADFVEYFHDMMRSEATWFEEYFNISGRIGNREFHFLPDVVHVENINYWCISDDRPQSSILEYYAYLAELGEPEITVLSEDPISFELSIHHTKPGCKAFATQEGTSEAWFTIQNTGNGPLKLRLTAEPEGVFGVFVQNEILMPGEETGVKVWLRSFAAGRRVGVVRIMHNDPNEGDIEIEVIATVELTFEDVNEVVSDDFRAVICSWADLVNFARGFPWWRSYFDELPIDEPYLEVFDLGIRDPDDEYRFVARAESGELLAEISTHTYFKRLCLPVHRNDSLSCEVELRDQSTAKAREPFFFNMRKQTLQMISSITIEEPRTAMAMEGGLCVTSAAGLTLVDTIDPWQPVVAARLETVGSLNAVATVQNHAFAVGEKGLFLFDLSDLKKPKQLALMEEMAGAVEVRQHGRHLWVVHRNNIVIFEVSKEHTLKLFAESRFEGNARGFVLCRGQGVVLDQKGLLVFELQGNNLSLLGRPSIDHAGSLSVSTLGALLCLTDAKMGSHLLDISRPESPEVVAHYGQPFWRSGFVMNISRNLGYKLRSKGNGYDIFLVRSNKVIRP